MKFFFLNIFLLFLCFPGRNFIQTLSSKFRLIGGKSLDVSNGNSALLDMFTFNPEKQSSCQKECLKNPTCGIFLLSLLNSTCFLFTIDALAQQQFSSSDAKMYLKVSSQLITQGLVNYWPIYNNLKDFVGGADLIPMLNVSYAADRFNEPNMSLSLKGDGYYKVPNGVYFNGDFSILALVRVNQLKKDAKIIDFGNLGGVDVLEFSLSYLTSGRPYFSYVESNSNICQSVSSAEISLDQWHHLAVVFQGLTQFLYLDGVLVAQTVCDPQYVPKNVIRSDNKIGRSSWYPAENDAFADFDEIKIYSRALSREEILADSVYLPY